MLAVKCNRCGQSFCINMENELEQERFLDKDNEHCPVCAGTVPRNNDFIYHENMSGCVAYLPIEDFRKESKFKESMGL